MDKLRVSIGVCAYQEEKNIARLLEALRSQRTQRIEISQIIVVSSACQDRTDELVSLAREADARVQLIQQPQRCGKASAVNLFLGAAIAEICALEGADTIPHPEALERLCAPFFQSPRCGMTGGHPVPVDDPTTFLGFAVHLVWRLHHKVACIQPKLGEMVAFRNIIEQLPEDGSADEGRLEQMVLALGYETQYAPEAYVYNKGPGTLGDFLRQRRRIYNRLLCLKKTTGYQVSTLKKGRVLRLLLRELRASPKLLAWTVGAVGLELLARLLGSYDFHICKKNPNMWAMASTTKALVEVGR